MTRFRKKSFGRPGPGRSAQVDIKKPLVPKEKKAKFYCEDGPYKGHVIWLSKTIPNTMIFMAGVNKGYYCGRTTGSIIKRGKTDRRANWIELSHESDCRCKRCTEIQQPEHNPNRKIRLAYSKD